MSTIKQIQTLRKNEREFRNGVNAYLETMPKLLGAMRTADLNGDYLLLARIAGHMSELAAMLDLRELMDICERIRALDSDRHRQGYTILIRECVTYFYSSISTFQDS